MGQTIGRAPLVGAAQHFVNLPKSSIYEQWEGFNDIAEGFGLTVDEVCEMIRVTLKDSLQYTEKKLDAVARALFLALDDDHNSLVDALEFLSAIALISGMTHEEKVRYIFGIYDFDESGRLTVDELILALRSCMSGLAKLSGIDAPLESEIEHIAIGAFDDLKTIAGSTISRDDFVKYAMTTPEIVSWIEYYADLDEINVTSQGTGVDKVADRLVAGALEATGRGDKHLAVMDDDAGLKTWAAIEAKGPAAELGVRTEAWRSTAAFTQPTVLPKHIPSAAPEASLTLEWAYGMNAAGRQQVAYVGAGEIAFPAGSLGVVYDIKGKKQRFVNGHSDVVTCLRVHKMPSGPTLVATGQVGPRPKILVWNARSMGTAATLRGFHRHAVTCVDFSPNGELLASVSGAGGAGAERCVAVYEWRTRSAVFTAVATDVPILDCRWLDDASFSTCGVDHIHFWSRRGANVFRRQRGLMGKRATKQPVLCVAAVGTPDPVVSGVVSGHLLVWEGRNCVRAIKSHSGAVTALHAIPGVGLASGSTDGKIQLWNESLEVGATFDVASLGGLSRVVHSLCWDVANERILVATGAAEVFEVSADEGHDLHEGALVQGHYDKRLHGMASHPNRPSEFVTVGGDKTVRVWDGAAHRLLKMMVLDTMARSVAYSPDGTMIAVGLGGVDASGRRQRKEGAFVVLNESDLTIIHEARDSKQLISDIRFSPDGRLLALASHDRSLYLYNVGDFATTAKCRGHKGRVEKLDWSEDSKLLQTCDDAGELLFWDAEAGEQRPPRAVRDVQWRTQRCPFGWSMQKAWGEYDDGTVVTASARAHAGEVIVCADAYRRLRLFRYPVVGENPPPACRTYVGHGAHVSNVEFACDDTLLFSTGGEDCVVLQWRHSTDPPEEDVVLLEDEPKESDAADYIDGPALDRPPLLEAACTDDLTALFNMEEHGTEDHFVEMRSWQRTIVAPTSAPVEDLSQPADRLELEWIHGHRCHDVRSNVLYTSTAEILFHTGQVCVVMSGRERSQRFYRGHAGDVLCLATHPTRSLAASGDKAKTPAVCVWDYETCKTVRTLAGLHRRAVTQLSFSSDGSKLLSIGSDTYHTVAVHDWENGTLLAKAVSCEQKTLALLWSPSDRSFVQAGVNFLRFWEVDGANMSSKLAMYGGKGKLQNVLCLGFVGNYTIAGTFDGSLYRFVGRQLDQAIVAHTGAVLTMSSCNEGLCTGGKDGLVKLWSTTLEVKLEVDMAMLNSLDACVRSVLWDNELKKVLVGTAGAEIYELSAEDGANFHGDAPLTQGHFGGELWGLTVHPREAEFATTGDDASLRIWDLGEHKMKSVQQLEMASRACAYSPDGSRIAIGYGTDAKMSTKQFAGKFVVMRAHDLSIEHEARDSQKWITEIKYSPNGSLLACGAFNNRIYVYNVEDSYILAHMITQHNSFVTHLDFDSTSQMIQSNCGAYELCFFESDTGMYIPTASRLKDRRWATHTCPLTWATQGIWPAHRDGTDVTAVDVNVLNQFGQLVIASGDNYGRLRLSRYPCQSSFAKYKQYRGHGAHITKARWAGGDAFLLTCSAGDRSIFQWRHDADDEAANDRDEAQPAQLAPDDAERCLLPNAAQGLEVAATGPAAVQVEVGGLGDENEVVTAKPWLMSIVEPSDPPPNNVAPPDVAVSLQRLHGFESRLSRGALHYNGTGEIIYPSSSMVVVYSKQTHQQRYFKGHAFPVTAVAVSANGRFVASGERCAQPTVKIWDSATCVEVCALRTFHRQAVASAAFDASGTRLVTVGVDGDHSLALWRTCDGEWHDGEMAANASGGCDTVHFAGFACADDGEFALVSGGVDHTYFWTEEGHDLVPQAGLWAGAGKVQPMLCGAAVESVFVTGGVSGHLYVWRGRTCEKMIRAHERGVECVHSTAAGLVTGGADGFVKVFNKRLEHVRSYDLSEATDVSLDSRVVSVSASLDAATGTSVTKILVGTAGAEVYEVAKDSGSVMLLAEGHHDAELWALAAHPTDSDIYATAGDDMTVRVWSISLSRMLRKAQVDSPVRCLAWSPDGKRLLLGMGGSSDGKRRKKDGAFLMLNALTLAPLFEGRDARHWIRDCRYSPDGKTFAIGSTDQKIYLYDASSTVLRAKCVKHNAAIQCVDFSSDSAYVQSDGIDFEHLYHSSMDGAHFKLPSQLKNVQWETWSCIYGWPVQGIWPSMADTKFGGKAEPSCVQRSCDGKMLAAGYEDGTLRVYRYPCLEKRAEYVADRVGKSPVSRIAWAADDKHLVAIGRADRAIYVFDVAALEQGGAASVAGTALTEASTKGQ